MRQLVLSLVLILAAPLAAHGYQAEARAWFGPRAAPQTLRVISTGDVAFFAPILESFVDGRADVAVDYVQASSAELMRAIHDEGARFDVALSSAMDLQTKLANDGRARAHRSAQTARLPDWARWRSHLFAFTQEPAAMVLSRRAFAGLALPRTRQELITALRGHPERFRGKVGTYDPRTSGLGYLFATQDARMSETFWRLSEVMGALDVRLYCCSADMIDAVNRGDLAVAYNVLGSYAQERADAAGTVIVLPADFTTVMLRTALIPDAARRPDLAGRFVDHLIGAALAGNSDAPGAGLGGDAAAPGASPRRIRMGPGLLVYLDQLKKEYFLDEWSRAMLQP